MKQRRAGRIEDSPQGRFGIYYRKILLSLRRYIIIPVPVYLINDQNTDYRKVKQRRTQSVAT